MQIDNLIFFIHYFIFTLKIYFKNLYFIFFLIMYFNLFLMNFMFLELIFYTIFLINFLHYIVDVSAPEVV